MRFPTLCHVKMKFMVAMVISLTYSIQQLKIIYLTAIKLVVGIERALATLAKASFQLIGLTTKSKEKFQMSLLTQHLLFRQDVMGAKS